MIFRCRLVWGVEEIFTATLADERCGLLGIASANTTRRELHLRRPPIGKTGYRLCDEYERECLFRHLRERLDRATSDAMSVRIGAAGRS